MKIQVVKRDGTLENFDQDKIVRVVMAAGLTDAQAQELAAKVSEWVTKLEQEKITSLKLKDKVGEELKKLDEHAHDLYRWYQETKAKNSQSITSDF